MATATFAPAVSGDDAFTAVGNSLLTNNSTSLAIGYVDATQTYRSFFVRFPSVNIPQGSTINTAAMRLRASASRSSTTVNATIKGEAADNPAAPTTFAGAAGRTRTTASVTWANIASVVANNEQSTPDFASVIQEIVNRAGWVSGNALIVYVDDTGSTASNATDRVYAAQDHLTLTEPQLDVDWTPPAAGGARQSMTLLGVG